MIGTKHVAQASMAATRCGVLKERQARIRDPESAASFPIAVLGASAGGLNAICAFLSAFTEATGFAFILLQRLNVNYTRAVGVLLSRHTSMAIVEAIDGTEILPDHMYIIPM